MGERDAGEPRYAAFLSYSHKDAAAAGRLHRRLETYRIPKRLVGTETARGRVPERLWPIFRDRDELPAATDLSETVREALARSGALIILCSPHSAGSLWVAEEIDVFRRLHPDRPILAAVLGGDPPDCFPGALRAMGPDGTGHEPLATDLRPQRDGPRLGLLKLVAGITGVSLDALVQRDATRRIRRVTVVTAAALIAMLIMAALALVALDARQDAERQRIEAKGLADFMLNDLREKLRGVGRLDIMASVNERALAFYDRQARLRDLPADAIMRARTLHAIGEDALTRGDLDAALAAFRDAHRTTTEQLAREENDPQRLLEHGRSEYWIGRVHELRREWPAAQRQYTLFADTTDRLIAVAPNNPQHMMQVAWAAVDLGNVQLNGIRDFAAAQRSYEKAVHWFGRAADARPRDRDAPRAQANAYAYLADSFFMRQLWRESLDARLRQYRIVERLHRADPSDLENAYRFALAQQGVAVSLARVGDRGRARPQLFSAYAWSGRLVRRDPSNAEWQLLRAFVGCQLYFGDLGLPAGVTRARLRSDIRAVQATLTAQRNPRVSEFSNCVRALH